MTEESFASLMAEDFTDHQHLEPGAKIEAQIVRIAKEWVFLDLGGKSEGVLSIGELQGKDGELDVQEGDRLEVYFLGIERNEKVFTRKISGAASIALLEEAWRGQVPVEGTVDKEVKGGFEVKIAGNVRGFCPYSQASLRRMDDASVLIGEVIEFKIIEYRENGRTIILSRRKILEEEREVLRQELQETLEIGQTVTGTITSVRDFGAFVDIGGLEGLIPVSEISWEHVSDLHSLLEPGQEVSVSVMKLDWNNDRFSFSLRATMPDPWTTCAFAEGTTISGRVVRLTPFGAFVNLAPGIDGLVHISNLGAGRRINHPREVVKDGEELEVRLDSIDLENKRISLSLVKADSPEEGGKQSVKDDGQQEGRDFQTYKKKAAGSDSPMGTLGDLLKAKMK